MAVLGLRWEIRTLLGCNSSFGSVSVIVPTAGALVARLLGVPKAPGRLGGGSVWGGGAPFYVLWGGGGAVPFWGGVALGTDSC